MPNMANVTIKKYDAATDLVLTALNSFAGLQNPAVWRVESLGTVAANRPVITCTSKQVKDGSGSIVEFKAKYPETYVDSATGLVKRNKILWEEFRAFVSTEVADATVKEAACMLPNFLVTALGREILVSGRAPV